ncbi:MAG: PilZ domain-containing protein [Pseudomonadota bacterium]
MKNPDVDQAVEDSLRVLQGLSKDDEDAGAAPAEPVPSPLPVFAAKLPRTNVRTLKRYLVKWRMAIVYEGGNGKKTFHGRVNDISLGGLSIHCDHNVFYEGKVILLLALPPLNAGTREKILEISCRMNYTILSQQLFRIGLEFMEFRKGDKKLLEERLEISNAGGMAYMDL